MQGGEIEWHGAVPGEPDWSDSSRLVAFSQRHPSDGGLYVAFNSSHRPAVLELPRWYGRVWQPFIDSGKVRSGLSASPSAPSRQEHLDDS